MEHEELTRVIIGCAYDVYNAMGSGFVESVYEACLKMDLEDRGLAVESQAPIVVRYRGRVVGEFLADLFVEKTVIVELKAVRTLLAVHEVQLVNYLTATGIDIGLLINFGDEKVEVKRKHRKPLKRESDKD